MNDKQSKNGLVLIEMLIALMFFSLAAAVCLQLFAGARQTNEQSADLNMAVICGQNIAECFKAANGDLDKTAALLGASADDGQLRLCYDENWDLISGSSPRLAHLQRDSQTDELVIARLTVSREGVQLLSFPLSALRGDS